MPDTDLPPPPRKSCLGGPALLTLSPEVATPKRGARCWG